MKRPTKTPVAPVREVAERPSTFVDFRLEGVIEAVQPIHVTTPDNLPKDQEGVILVPRMVNGQRVDRASVKGTTFKGAARRCGYRVAQDVMGRRTNDPSSNHFGLRDYYRLAVGGVKGRGSQAPNDVFLLMKTEARNPVAYLFGAAEPYWMEGKVRFGFATAQQDDAWGPIAAGARIDSVQKDPALLASFSEKDRQDWLSYADTNKATSLQKGEIAKLKKEMRNLLKNGRPSPADQARIDEIKATIEGTNTDIATRKKREVVAETVGRPLDPVNAIYSGALLDHRLDATRLTHGQFGFFLKTLEKMSEDPRIGGLATQGYGLFRAKWNLRTRVTERGLRGPWQDIGEVALDMDDLSLPDHPVIAEALAAFDDMVHDRDVDFLFEERTRGTGGGAGDADADDADAEDMAATA